MVDMLKAALWYQKQGLSVVPAKKDKKCFVSWQGFQKTQPTEVQIREWWQKWPNANIAIITGLKSNLTVLDADSEKGKAAVEDMIPDTLNLPVVKTPRGWHYYFCYAKGVRNRIQVLKDCDIRSEGGYVIAPPSKNGSATPYTWVKGLSIVDNSPPEIPSFLLDMILSSDQNAFSLDSNKSLNPLVYNETNDDKSELLTTNDDTIPQGRRDHTIFHVANCLVKGGMDSDNIRFFLNIIAGHCQPKFSEKDVLLKIKSALERSKRRDLNITEIVKDYVLSSSGVIMSSEIASMSSLSSRDDKKAMSKVLSRMVADGIIERHGNKNGCFRKIESELNRMDIFNVKSEYLDIKYPLDIHELFRTMPRNIIVIAGTQNVGKTAFMLNLAAMNMNKGMNVRYFTSEMGEQELKARCQMFEPETPFSFWKNVEFCDHSSGFADRLDPDGLNIIDYLEISSDFPLIAEKLKRFYEKLDKGVAVVALQKAFGKDLGRGAEFSLEKPRLYVSLDSNPPEGNTAKIVKCKNFARDDINPNHMECLFNVIQGVKIRMIGGRWCHPTKG